MVLQVPARARQALDRSRLLFVPPVVADLLDRLRPASNLGCCCSLSLSSICLLRNFSTAFPQVLGAATRSFQSLSIGVAVAGK